MRDLNNDNKIQAKSCPEIQDGLSTEAKRLKRRGLTWKYKASHGPMMNWVFAWFLAQTNEEKERIAREGKKLLEAILSDPYTEPGSTPKPAGPSKANGRGGSAKRLPDNRNTDKAVSQDTAIIGL